MFQDRYFVPKSTDTYADILAAWGLAVVLEDVLRQAGQPRANKVTVSEEATAFVVELPVTLQESWVGAAQKTRLTYFFLDIAEAETQKQIAKSEKSREQADAAKGKTKLTADAKALEANNKATEAAALLAAAKSTSYAVNMDEQWKRIARRKEWLAEGNDPKSDDPNVREIWMALQPHEHFNLFATAQKLSGDAPANKIWEEVEKINYAQLLRALLKQFSGQPFQPFGSAHSTATLLNPGQGMGTNDLTPRGAGGDKIKDIWPIEWLKMIGFYLAAFAVSFQNSKGKTSGVSVIILCPRRISLRNHYEIRRQFVGAFYAASALKLECLAALRYADVFLLYAQSETDSEDLRGQSIADAVSGFSLAYFMDVRQGVNFVVKRITFLAMPPWIRVPPNGDVEPMREAVAEHIKVLRPLDDSRGETRSLLDSYLAWSSSGELCHLWKFCALYGAYRMECAADTKLPFQPTALTTTNLEVILMSQNAGEKPLVPVVQDPHFQNIARAIRKSTITALYRRSELPSGMEVHYGLAQELRRSAPYKDKFSARLMQHLQIYNEENAKVSTREINANSPFRRANVTTHDLERLVELIDEYGAETICGLLLAYGYARDPREEKDTSTPPDDSQPTEQI